MDAFRGVYERHHQAMYRLALFLTGDPARAEDLAADAFVRAWTARHRIRHHTRANGAEVWRAHGRAISPGFRRYGSGSRADGTHSCYQTEQASTICDGVGAGSRGGD